MVHHVHETFYYGGSWNRPVDDQAGVIEVVSPSTEETLGTVPEPVEGDIDRAVAVARRAFDDPHGWPQWSPDRRAEVMEEFASRLEARGAELATLVTAQNGMPIRQSMATEAGTAPFLLRYYASLIRGGGVEEVRSGDGRSTLVRTEPGGVVAAIVPWNFPVGLTFLKLAPLLAAGCTVVLKPARETVLDSYVVAQCAAESGFPPGVINIVPGHRDIGAYLVSHPGVDRVTFTGSTAGGRSVATKCAELLRPVSLELGGKSAAVLLDDVDFDAIRDDFFLSTLRNNGQTCWLSTRILVPKQRHRELTDAVTDLVRSLVVGHPAEESTDIGPLTSLTQRERVENYIQIGTRDGGRVTTGGRQPSAQERGWFVEPTVFADVDNSSVIAQEEIFGPVLCVVPYDDIDDAVAMANDSRYGLGGTVWTKDVDRGLEIARRIETGAVGINGFNADVRAPFGGVKDSGSGSGELGPEGLLNYRRHKSIYM